MRVHRKIRQLTGRRLTGRRLTRSPARGGLATLDYVLVLCVCLPMVVFTLWAGPRLMNLVYQMTCVLVSWPFL